MTLTEANRRAIGRVLASEPWLVGIRPAAEVVPGMRRELILHAAPPAASEDLSPVLRGGILGAAQFEGLDPSAVELGAAQDHSAMAGGAGSITASTPVVVLEDRANGNRAFHFLMEGFGRTLILGMYGEDVRERLLWLRDELAPALDAAIAVLGGIDCGALMAEALRRGDELHNRNAAATSNSKTFTDSTGEDPNAPDITTIVVSNDNAGLTTFKVNISNRPAMTNDMLVLVFLDTDQKASTGDQQDGGAEYVIELDPGVVTLYKWNGSDYNAAASQSSVTFSYDSSGATMRASAHDLANTKGFNFYAIAVSGITTDAPDSTAPMPS